MIKIVKGQDVKDGAGVKLNRVIGTRNLDMADPFLMLDEFRNDDKKDYEAGFPMHPHRGFETITYMVEGSFTHRDSKGNVGRLNAGEVQWMTAGKGIIHEEMPAMENGSLWGYQLWINLPARLKMVEPKYRHLTNEIMPVVEENGLKVKIISGAYQTFKGPVELYFDVDYFDVRISDGSFRKKLKGTTLIYVHTGEVEIAGEKNITVEKGTLAVITEEAEISVIAKDSGFLFLSADPINEPVAKYGPFVMNTSEELIQAVDDFNEGRFV